MLFSLIYTTFQYLHMLPRKWIGFPKLLLFSSQNHGSSLNSNVLYWCLFFEICERFKMIHFYKVYMVLYEWIPPLVYRKKKQRLGLQIYKKMYMGIASEIRILCLGNNYRSYNFSSTIYFLGNKVIFLFILPRKKSEKWANFKKLTDSKECFEVLKTTEHFLNAFCFHKSEDY